MGFLNRWRQWLPIRRQTWRVVDRTGSGADIPFVIPARGAILVNSLGVDRFLAFDCPCADRHRIILSLDEGRHPRWEVRHADPLTIWPSVDDRTDGRRCHFVLRRGKVRWVPDDVPERVT